MEINQGPTSSGSAQPIKRPRGRPRKYPLPQLGVSTTLSPGLSGSQIPNVSQPGSLNPTIQVVSATASPEPSNISANSAFSGRKQVTRADSLESRSAKKTIILPARRSARQATIHSTQISEGTLRPPGPPPLEAALNIALANLDSETWGYLARYLTKNRQKPLPTPAQMKAASATIRRAAVAVDRADKELKDAVDQIMLENAKKKRRGTVPGSKYVEQPVESDPSTRSSTPGKETLSRGHSVACQSKPSLGLNEGTSTSSTSYMVSLIESPSMMSILTQDQ